MIVRLIACTTLWQSARVAFTSQLAQLAIHCRRYRTVLLVDIQRFTKRDVRTAGPGRNIGDIREIAQHRPRGKGREGESVTALFSTS